tara:strand:+ start:574 stop:723 length:150 start_codon:yes stop_codon:yes gene_type:complete
MEDTIDSLHEKMVALTKKQDELKTAMVEAVDDKDKHARLLACRGFCRCE